MIYIKKEGRARPQSSARNIDRDRASALFPATANTMATLSEAPLHHPQLPDFSALRELPDSHAWPKLPDHPAAGGDGRGHHDEPVPVVDLRDPQALGRIADACQTWGVFLVTGHGVPAGLLDRVESECRRLFALPADRKLRALRPPDGISGYGLARISPFFSKLMWSEGFTIVGSPVEHARKLWPQDHHQFCDVVEEYSREMKQLAGRLMSLMLAALGLRPNDVDWYRPPGGGGGGRVEDGFREASSVLQLNSYPACPEPDRAMGLAAHTDSSLLTILHQNGTSGLQVLRPAAGRQGPGRWVTVPPMRGALAVNVGDLLQIMTNGRFPSVVHRAVVNRTRHRLSVAYIYGPPATSEVAPLMRGLVTAGGVAGGGALYRRVTWPEYLRIKAEHFDRALAVVRVSEGSGGGTAADRQHPHSPTILFDSAATKNSPTSECRRRRRAEVLDPRVVPSMS